MSCLNKLDSMAWEQCHSIATTDFCDVGTHGLVWLEKMSVQLDEAKWGHPAWSGSMSGCITQKSHCLVFPILDDKNSNTFSFSFSFSYQFRLEVQGSRLFWVSLIQNSIEIYGPYVKNFCFDYTKLADRGYSQIASNDKLYFLSQ